MLTRKELKDWTTALRSGKYKQGDGYLKALDDTGELEYCCLGVLCEIQGIPNKLHKDFYEFDNDELGTKSSLLPRELSLKLGLRECGDFIKGMPKLDGNTSLTHANDNGVSFTEIADHLDKYYPCVD